MCKYTVAWRWCKNEWVVGETPNFYLLAQYNCFFLLLWLQLHALCPKMPFSLPTWTTDECFIFHKDCKTEFVVNLSWSDSVSFFFFLKWPPIFYIALPTLNPSASIGDYYGGFVSQTMACFFLSHFSFFSSSYAPSSSSNVPLPHSLCRHIE